MDLVFKRLSYEPSAHLRWHTLVSVNFPTRTGRRMYLYLQRCMGRASNYLPTVLVLHCLCPLSFTPAACQPVARRRRRRLSPKSAHVCPLHPTRNKPRGMARSHATTRTGRLRHLFSASGCPALRVAVAESVAAAATVLFLSATSAILLLIYTDPRCPQLLQSSVYDCFAFVCLSLCLI